MQDLLHWVVDNKEWIFSGIGVLAVSALLGFGRRWIARRREGAPLTQQQASSGSNSPNFQGIQTKGPFTVNIGIDNRDNLRVVTPATLEDVKNYDAKTAMLLRMIDKDFSHCESIGVRPRLRDYSLRLGLAIAFAGGIAYLVIHWLLGFFSAP